MIANGLDSVITGVLAPRLQHTSDDDRPVVVMTCGLAGSGKTTLAKSIQTHFPNFYRLSIDRIIARHHGIYGIDYPASSSIYAAYQREADDIYLSTFRGILAQKKNILLERSFFAKEDRDQYRNLVEEAGAKFVLVFLKAEGDTGKEMLWNRICKRCEAPKTADSALDISKELFKTYWDNFEDPVDEEEIVIRMT